MQATGQGQRLVGGVECHKRGLVGVPVAWSKSDLKFVQSGFVLRASQMSAEGSSVSSPHCRVWGRFVSEPTLGSKPTVASEVEPTNLGGHLLPGAGSVPWPGPTPAQRPVQILQLQRHSPHAVLDPLGESVPKDGPEGENLCPPLFCTVVGTNSGRRSLQRLHLVSEGLGEALAEQQL